MAAVDRIAEVEVLGIDVDTLILLGVDITVVAFHRSQNVGRTITVVGHGYGHLGTVHSSEPCTPVSLTTAEPQVRIVLITLAPTEVVGTYHSELSVILTAEHHHEVVPVVGTTGVVGEAADVCLIRSHLDVLGVSAPPTSRVVGSTEGGVHLVDHLELSRTDDGSCSALALIGLGISGDEGLLT